MRFAKKSTTSKSHARRRRGSALVIALICVVAVMGLTMAFVQIGTSVVQRQGHSVDKRHAFYLAEAGLAEAYSGMAVARTGNVGTPDRPAALAGGLFWVEATPLGDDRVQLESTGMWGAGRVTLAMVVEPVRESVAQEGFFASNDIQVEPGMLIDSWDARDGTYAEHQALGLDPGAARIASNGNVTISGGASGTVVKGDVIHGELGSLTTNGSVTVTGVVAPASEAVALPPVEFPGIAMGGDVTHNDAAPLVIPPGDLGMNSLFVKTSAVISGPCRLELGSLELASGASLSVDTSAGPVELFVHDEVVLASGSSVTTPNLDSSQLSLQVGPGGRKANVSLASNTAFYGMIYAPESEVYLGSSFEVFGAVAADRLKLSQGGQLHFDLAGAGGASLLPILHSWRVVDIPAGIASKSGDPFRILGVDVASCPAPSFAHEDQQLSLRYVDQTGAQRTYDGWESDFDWLQVAQVLNGSRDGVAFRAPRSGQDEDASSSDGEDLTPEEQALLDLINSSLTSRQLKRDLINASPLTAPVLRAAVKREPPMDHTDLKAVLLRNNPLAESVVLDAIDEPDFHGGSLVYILVDNSPLSDAELQATLDRDPPLEAAQLAEVLAAQ